MDRVTESRTAGRGCYKVSLSPDNGIKHSWIMTDGLEFCSLSKNHLKGADGGVTPDTYLAFVIIEAIA